MTSRKYEDGKGGNVISAAWKMHRKQGLFDSGVGLLEMSRVEDVAKSCGLETEVFYGEEDTELVVYMRFANTALDLLYLVPVQPHMVTVRDEAEYSFLRTRIDVGIDLEIQ